MDYQGPGRIQRILALLLSLLIMWGMLPEHQRKLIIMRLTLAMQRVSGTAARAEGHRGMGDELAGRVGEAERRYSVAYTLSRWRDAAARGYEAMRG